MTKNQYFFVKNIKCNLSVYAGKKIFKIYKILVYGFVKNEMLLFGDLHINSRICDRVVDAINAWIDQNPDEKNLIFLGDYVYHFSYDREALLRLYTLFLDLYKAGKNVYILAGNHDWLGNTFVFEEAKRTYEIIKKVFNDGDASGKIEFITQPKVENIEGEDILFLPYCLGLDGGISHDNEKSINDKVDFSPMVRNDIENSKIIEIENTVKTLSKSQNKNEKFSAELNNLLLKYYQKYGKLTVIHHYYTEGVNFPGQRGRFYFNDIALSHLFCELDGLKLISGHLHQGFAYKNYFCIGSVRNTSPLEVNQAKMLFRYSQGGIDGKIYFVNPYFQIKNVENDQKIDESFLQSFKEDVIKQNIENYQNQGWHIQIQPDYELRNKDISVSLSVGDVNYDDIYSYIDENLFKQLKDVKLKKIYAKTEDIFEKMDIEGKNLTSGFADWKGLLKDYLTNKYPEEYEKYLDFLRQEKII